jgi:hypothetical protein
LIILIQGETVKPQKVKKPKMSTSAFGHFMYSLSF